MKVIKNTEFLYLLTLAQLNDSYSFCDIVLFGIGIPGIGIGIGIDRYRRILMKVN